MTNALDFWIRLKTIRKGGQGLTPRRVRDDLLSEYLGPEMHAKLNLVYRTQKKRGVMT